MGIREIGKVIEFEDMVEGDVVEFVEYTHLYHSHWGFTPGFEYAVDKREDGIVGPLNPKTQIPMTNWGFVFKLVEKGDEMFEQFIKPQETTIDTLDGVESGMLVVLSDRRLCIVVGDVVFDENWNGLARISTQGCAKHPYKITEVYSNNHYAFEPFTTTDRKLLWVYDDGRKDKIMEEIDHLRSEQAKISDRIDELESELSDMELE